MTTISRNVETFIRMMNEIANLYERQRELGNVLDELRRTLTNEDFDILSKYIPSIVLSDIFDYGVEECLAESIWHYKPTIPNDPIEIDEIDKISEEDLNILYKDNFKSIGD